MLSSSDVAICKTYLTRHGKSYAFATRYFPKHLRDATAVLYAFFRVPDDMVDEMPGTIEEKRAQLETWKATWKQVYEGAPCEHPVLRATREVFLTYHIPFAYSEAFLDAMTQDLSVTTYATYADLEKYMYGSAAVVGLMMSHVIGFKNQETLAYAQALGEAMQLTNFIRDIKEDLKFRNRFYLPQEDLQAFGITQHDFTAERVSEPIKKFLQYEMNRAKNLYAYAEKGIDELAPAGRLPVRTASRLYEAILTNIEKAGYDIFTTRIHTTFFEKLVIFFTLWKQQKNAQSLSVQDLGA